MTLKKNSNDLAAPTIIFHYDGDIGYGQRRKRLEDRYIAKQLTTAGQLELVVGIIADGVGGGNAGERASQMTVDQILAFFEASTEKDVELLLQDAILAAHEAVREAGEQNPKLSSMSTTVTVAVILNNRLYLGHVGDSRAYLVRENNIQMLTLDHSWANEMIRQKKFSPEEVKKHPKRDDLGRYIGQPRQIPLDIDMGTRIFDDGEHPAHSLLRTGGLELNPGDVVILCSDGLIKQRHNGPGNYVEEHEIVDAVRRKRNSPEDIVNTLISRALGRQTDDNVSVVALAMSGGRQSPLLLPAAANISKWLIPAGIFVTVVLLTLMVFSLLWGGNLRDDTEPTAQNGNDQEAVILQVDSGSVQVQDGVLNYQLPDEKINVAIAGEEIPVSSRMWTDTGTVVLSLSDGTKLFLGEYSTISFTAIFDPAHDVSQTELMIEKGAVLVHALNPLMMEANPHTSQAWAAARSWMGISYREDGYFTVDCLDGTCQLRDGEVIPLQAGQRGIVEKGNMNAEWVLAEYDGWVRLGGQAVPTATLTPSPTVTPSPTMEPTPTLTATSQSPQVDPVIATDPSGDTDEPAGKTPEPTKVPPPAATSTPPPGAEG